MTLESYSEPVPDKNLENNRAESLSPAEWMAIKNYIQAALMADSGIVKGDIGSALAWVEQYASDFSDYLHEHPQLVLDWKGGKTEAVLEKLTQAEKDGFPHRDTH